MKILSVIFLNAVPDLLAAQSAPSFSAASADTNGNPLRFGGYSLEASDDGIVCRHAKAPTKARCVPWHNVRYFDVDVSHEKPECVIDNAAAQVLQAAKVDKRTKAYRESLPTKPEA